MLLHIPLKHNFALGCPSCMVDITPKHPHTFSSSLDSWTRKSSSKSLSPWKPIECIPIINS